MLAEVHIGAPPTTRSLANVEELHQSLLFQSMEHSLAQEGKARLLSFA
jgi:hypothetical protein